MKTLGRLTAVLVSCVGVAGLAAVAAGQVEQGPWSPRPPTRVPVSRVPEAVQYPINDRRALPPRPPLPEIEDAAVAAVVGRLSGSFRAGAVGDQPGVDFHMARVDVDGADAAVYFEVARSDKPGAPFRQGIYLVARVDGELRLRVMEFNGLPTFPDSVVGLWLWPERFPAMGLRFLKPVMDLVVKQEGDGFTAATKGRVPARQAAGGAEGGAVAWEVESTLAVRGDSLLVTDKLFDKAGQALPGWSGTAREFKRFKPESRARMVDGCLLLIDLIPPTEGSVAIGADMHAALTYRGWQTSGRLFASYERENKGEPIQIKWPSGFIIGFGEGIKGLTVGSLRRMVIPPGLAFGDGGDIRWEIEGGDFLTFEVQPVWIDTHENLMNMGAGPDRPGVIPASRKDPGR